MEDGERYPQEHSYKTHNSVFPMVIFISLQCEPIM